MRPRVLGMLIGMVIASAVLVAACGGDNGGSSTPRASSAASATGTSKACALLTKAEAEQIIGQAIDPPTGADVPLGQKPGEVLSGYLQSSCQFQASEAKGVQSIITVTTHIPDASTPKTRPQSAKDYFDNLRSGFGDVTTVAGLGDAAFENKLGLNVLKGDIYVNVLVLRAQPGAVTTADPTDLDAEKAMAAKIVDRVK